MSILDQNPYRKALLAKKAAAIKLVIGLSLGSLVLGVVGWRTGKSMMDLVFPRARIKASRWPGKIVLPSDPLPSGPSPTPRGAKKVSTAAPILIGSPLA